MVTYGNTQQRRILSVLCAGWSSGCLDYVEDGWAEGEEGRGKGGQEFSTSSRQYYVPSDVRL